MNVTPSQLKDLILAAWTTRLPVLIESAPGLGKTTIVAQASDELAVPVQVLRGNSISSVDLRGLPDITAERTVWKRPDFIPESGSGILFLDEIGFSSPSVLQGFCGLINERHVAGHQLAPDWRIVGATNRITDRANVTQLPTPLLNRVTLVTLIPDIHDWLQWARANNIHPMVLSYLTHQPDALHQFDPHTNIPTSFPSPRSWEFVSRQLTACTGPLHLLPTHIEAIIFGLIGEDTARNFLDFLHVIPTLPKFADIVAGTAPPPPSASAHFALATALGLALKADPVTHIEAIRRYIDTFEPEYRETAVVTITSYCPTFITGRKP